MPPDLPLQALARLPAPAAGDPPGEPLPPQPQWATESDYVALAREVRAAGLLQPAPLRSFARGAFVALLFAFGWTAVPLVGDSWYQVLVAVYLAIVLGQMGFLGHEIGHRQVLRSHRMRTLAGLVCADLGVGMSFGYWLDKHDRHHGHPNQVGLDPDVGPGVLSWTAAQTAAKTGLGRVVARHQAALFFPLLLLEGANLHAASVVALRRKAVTHTRTEATLLGAHVIVSIGVLFAVMSPLRAIVFIAVQQGLFGLYLGCAFAPNHKGMPMPDRDEKLDFLRRQVTTSRNVRCGLLLGLAMGGLNYQIEHRLFPAMPMRNLRRCRPLVRAYCLRHEISYCEMGLARSYLFALRHLRDTGAPVASSAERRGPRWAPA